MDLQGDSSEEDEDLPIGITSEPTPAPVIPEPSIIKLPETSAALQAAIAAASADSQSININYASQASDIPELAHAENLVFRDPYNTRGWETICGQAQSLSLDRARPLYERFLRKFPTAGRYWKYYAEHEHREGGDIEKVNAVLERGLENTVSCELWRFYTEFQKASNTETEGTSIEEVDKAFKRAIDEMGASYDALNLWKDYVGWLHTRLDAVNPNDQFEAGKLQNHLREAYKRAIKLPIRGVGELWTAYEEFERSLVQESNRILAERILKDNEPIAKNSIALAKERGKLYDGVNVNLLACPSGKKGSVLNIEQLRQLQKWRELVRFEKDQSEATGTSVRLRVRHTYKQALCSLRYFPELWYEFAMEELESRDIDASLQVLATGCAVLDSDGQGCLVLQFSRASLLERLKRTVDARAIWQHLSNDRPSPLVHIQHMRFARRTDGMKAARKVFATARKSTDTCTWRVYVAAALLEFYSNNNVKVAGNIFELGLKRFPESVPFISQYVKFLSGLNEEASLRVLFQRVIGSQMNEEKPELTRPLWLQYMAFENSMVVDGGAVEACEQLERRFHDKYRSDDNSNAVPIGLSLQTYRYSFLDLHPNNPADMSLLARERHFEHGMQSGPLTFGQTVLPGSTVNGSDFSSSSSSSLSSSSSSSSSTASSSISINRDRSRSPMESRRSRSRSKSRFANTGHNGNSSNRSNSSNSSSSSSSNSGNAPTMILPSFLAPLMYGLPDDDNEVYWPTKQHDIRNVIHAFQKCELPPPPTEEECARIKKIRDGLHGASWKDTPGGEGEGGGSGSKSGGGGNGGGGEGTGATSSTSSSSSATNGEKGKGKGKGKGNSKRKRDDETDDTPRVKTRKNKGTIVNMNDISHLLELTNHLIDFDAAQSIPSHGQHEQPPHNIQSTVSSCRNEIEERLNHLEPSPSPHESSSSKQHYSNSNESSPSTQVSPSKLKHLLRLERRRTSKLMDKNKQLELQLCSSRNTIEKAKSSPTQASITNNDKYRIRVMTGRICDLKQQLQLRTEEAFFLRAQINARDIALTLLREKDDNLHSKSLSPNAAKHPHRQHPKPKKSNSPKNKIKSAKTPSSPQPPTKSMKQTWLEPQYKSNSPPPPPPPSLPPPTLSTNLNGYNGYQPSNKESQHSEQEWNNHKHIIRMFREAQQTRQPPHRSALQTSSAHKTASGTTHYIATEKTKEEARMLSKGWRHRFFNQTLDSEVRDAIYKVTHRHSFDAGEDIFTNQEIFLVVIQGGITIQTGIGSVVDLVTKGKTFGIHWLDDSEYPPAPGELKLVTTTNNTVVFVITKEEIHAIRTTLTNERFKRTERILMSIDLFSTISSTTLAQLVYYFESKIYFHGQYIIRQGSKGSSFFVVDSGVVEIEYTDKDGIKKKLQDGGKSYCFGERALLEKGAVRGASVIAKGRVRCLVLSKKHFNALVPHEKLINKADHETREREGTLGGGLGGEESTKSKSSGNVTNADQEKLKDLTFINRSELNSSHVRLEELEQIAVIGKGHRSIVKLVHWNAQNDLGGCFALKTIPLHSLRTADAMDKLKTERDILAFMTKTIKSPWVIQLCNTFYDQNGLHLLLECGVGGDLLSLVHRKLTKQLKESVAQFLVAGIVLGLEHLHAHSIMHRDLKTENICIDSRGYPKICDFDNAKHATRAWTSCGTPFFMAPETVLNKGHDQTCDYWSLGCILYELMTSKTPFEDQFGVLSIENQLRGKFYPVLTVQGTTEHSSDILHRLLTTDPQRRLGAKGGIDAIKKHSWFSCNRKFSWKNLENRKIHSPLRNFIRGHDDIVKNFYLFSDQTIPFGLEDVDALSKNEYFNDDAAFNESLNGLLELW